MSATADLLKKKAAEKAAAKAKGGGKASAKGNGKAGAADVKVAANEQDIVQAGDEKAAAEAASETTPDGGTVIIGGLTPADHSAETVKKLNVTDLNALYQYLVAAGDLDEHPKGWAKLFKPVKLEYLSLVFDTADTGTGTEVAGDAPSDTEPGTEVAVDDTKTGEVLEADTLVNLAHEIENIKTKVEAEKLVASYVEDGGFADFKLGGVLCKIRDSEWFEGYDTFYDYVHGMIGFKKRKAQYLMAIYTTLLDMQIPWEKLAPLGWPKTVVLLDVITAANVDKWIKKVGGMTYLNAKAEVDAAVKKAAGTSEPAKIESEVSSKTFKLHKDQAESVAAALEKAKKESGTDVEAVALDHVCNVYLAPGAGKAQAGKGKKVSMTPADGDYQWPESKQMFEHLLVKHEGDVDECMKDLFSAFETIFPKVHLTVKVNE